MPFLFLIILLFLPLADIVLAARWLLDSPFAAGLYFTATAALGALLTRFAKIGISEAARLLFAGEAPPAAVAGFVKLWLAGALLFFPGYASDALAALILCLPSARIRGSGDGRSSASESSSGREVVAEVAAEVVEENGRKRERD